MDSESFSFTKKPIYCNQKRHSVISDIIPSESSNYTTAKDGVTPHKYTDSASARTLSSNSENYGNLVKSDSSPDDPLLDYDEQIRAPKFQSKKSLNDIGSSSQKFESNDLMDKSNQKKNSYNKRRTNSYKSNSTTDSTSSSMRQNKCVTLTAKSTYQPAKVDISKLSTSASSSLPKETTSTSLGDNLYNIDQYLVNATSSNIIYNNDTATTTPSTTRSNSSTTTPAPSKKSSHESILQFTFKKTPRFNMTPLRSIDDPKTLDYLPCVLRPNSYNPTGVDQSFLDHFNQEETTENTIRLSHEHWKPNNCSSACFDCGRQFSLMYRRHHCRKCGEIFCGNCLLSKARLTFQCEFDVDGVLAKVCFGCGRNWSNFLIENFKKIDSTLYPNFNKKDDVITAERDLHQDQQHFGDKRGVAVPADWTWSSF